ncbi:hypothetical protein ONZ43_g1285 [Nemania bipapillata]|uniref:Uncharacterized protein n=1 Tax=Nemania bipapillata TaxID=110536 RepID=A0ACC2J4Y8_9PEZI|nr:hypothetical protein ONZ43_g1285 [Nemania bipapillata]
MVSIWIQLKSKAELSNAVFCSTQPPKRKAPTGSAKDCLPKERQSKLAKEHNISAREEREIKEAFALFAEPMDGQKEGVIPAKDVRRAMMYVFSLCLLLNCKRPFSVLSCFFLRLS